MVHLHPSCCQFEVLQGTGHAIGGHRAVLLWEVAAVRTRGLRLLDGLRKGSNQDGRETTMQTYWESR